MPSRIRVYDRTRGLYLGPVDRVGAWSEARQWWPEPDAAEHFPNRKTAKATVAALEPAPGYHLDRISYQIVKEA